MASAAASRQTTSGLLTAHSISLRTMPKIHSKRKPRPTNRAETKSPPVRRPPGGSLLDDGQVLDRLVEQDGATSDDMLAGADGLRPALAHGPRLAQQIDDILKATHDADTTANEDWLRGVGL